MSRTRRRARGYQIAPEVAIVLPTPEAVSPSQERRLILKPEQHLLQNNAIAVTVDGGETVGNDAGRTGRQDR